MDLLRDAPKMLRSPLTYLSSVEARYGPVVEFPMPNLPVFFFAQPQAAHHILVANQRGYSKRTVQYDTLALVTGQGLLVSDPPLWREHRQIVQPAFHHSELPRVVEHAGAAALRVLGRLDLIASGAVVDVDELMMQASLEVVGGALFGTDLSGRATELVEAVLTALDQVIARARSPWTPPTSVPTPGNRRLVRALSTLDDAVAMMIAARRRQAATSDVGLGDDLLGILLRSQDQPDLAAGGAVDSPRLSDDEVRDEIVTLLIAGHETVASSLTWTFHLLGASPSVRQELAAEVRGVLGHRQVPVWDDLKALPYTRAVIDEGLRLYPPAWIITRRAIADDVVCGVEIPAGAMVLISPYTIQRSEHVWSDPLTFDPTRWLGLGRKHDVRNGYLPFGAGMRLCIGRDFALVESVVLLAALARELTFTAVGAKAPVVDALVTLRPRGGLAMRLDR